MSPKKVREILSQLGIKPSKARSQNFLTDENIASWQVEQADIRKDDIVLEIGAGLGILTRHIMEKTENLIVIEYDRVLASYLEKEFNIDIICEDVLRCELPKFDKVISNLPYHISSEITAKLLVHDFKAGILMYQKEFAAHLVAGPGSKNYSRISVLANYYADCEIIKTVPKGAYYPSPKVDSSIVRIKPRPAGFTPKNEKFYFDIVRMLFSHKNRKIRNALVSEAKQLGIEKSEIKKWADEVPYADDRAVTLAPEKINEIVEWLRQKMQ